MELKEIEKTIIERTITKITSLATKIRISCFNSCTALTDISFPNATSIGAVAFYGCTTLTDISFPNVTSISVNAFYGCTALTDISFPNVTSISVSAFSGCTALTDISFPNVTSIGGYAFQDCTALTDISFPNVTSIEDSAFSRCTALTDVKMPKLSFVPLNNLSSYPNLKLYVGREGYFPRISTLNSIINCRELHIEGTVLTSMPSIGTTTVNIYFEYVDGDTYNFTPALTKGTSKTTKSYDNLFTDNTTIKNTLMSFADEYTTVTVKHLDGSDW